MSQIGRFFNSSGAGPLIQTLTGNSGGPVPPDFAGNINTLGGLFIDVVGNPATNTLTWNITGSIAAQYNTDSGSAVPIGNILNVLGGTGITTSGAGNTITIDVDGTIPDQFDGNSGSAIPAAGILNIKVNHATLPAYFDGSTVNFYASGNNVLLSFTDNADNTGVGYQALGSATQPLCDNNTAFGFACLRALNTGINNTAIGSQAGVVATGAQNNTIVGNDAAILLTTGNANVIIGVEAGNNLLTGVGNLIIGAADDTGAPVITSAGTNYAAAESNNVCIGNPGVAGENNTIRLGTTGSGPVQQNRCFIGGIDGVNVGSVAEVVTMGTGGAADQLGTAVITAGSGITITPGANTITISATGADLLAYTNVATTPYVVLTTDEYLSVDSSGGARTIQLPNAPSTGRVFYIKDRTGSAATNNITVTTVGGVVNIDGATSFVMNTNLESISVVFSGTAYEVF